MKQSELPGKKPRSGGLGRVTRELNLTASPHWKIVQNLILNLKNGCHTDYISLFYVRITSCEQYIVCFIITLQFLLIHYHTLLKNEYHSQIKVIIINIHGRKSINIKIQNVFKGLQIKALLIFGTTYEKNNNSGRDNFKFS